jgi:hypothetical protein
MAYGLAFLFAGNKLWNSEGLKTPGGLLIAGDDFRRTRRFAFLSRTLY